MARRRRAAGAAAAARRPALRPRRRSPSGCASCRRSPSSRPPDRRSTPRRWRRRSRPAAPRVPTRSSRHLNPEQARAVTTTEGPLLILAGAGSGKTRVVAHRIAYLIGVKAVQPRRILAVTFTNRAAGELRERIAALAGEHGKDVQAGTFHALCARVLRQDGEAIGLDRRFVIYDTDDQQQLMKRILAEEDLPATGEFRPAAILGAISRAKNDMLDEAFLAEHAVNHRERMIARLAGRYRDRLRAANALDFDDLLLRAVDLFEQSPEALAKYHARWRYLHVDEYQDTNRPQYLWIRALASAHPQPVRGGRRRPVDLRLARGERPEHPRLRARLPRGDGGQARAELPLDAADPRRGPRGRVAQRAPDRQEAVDREPGRRADPALRGLQRGGGGRVDRPPGRGARRRARVRAHAARRRRRVEPVPGQGRRGHVPDERPVPGHRGGVPRATGIRYQLVGGTRFYQRREVKDALAYLRVLRSDTDVVSFERIINVPARGIGDKSVEALRRWAVAHEDNTYVGGPGGGGRRGRGAGAADPDGDGGVRPAPASACGPGSACCRCRSCSTRSSRRPATGPCSPTARRRARTAGPTCSSCARSRPATTTCRPTTRSTGCSRRRRSSPTRTRTRATPTRSR